MAGKHNKFPTQGSPAGRNKQGGLIVNKTKEKPDGAPGQVQPVVRDRHGLPLFVGNRVMLYDPQETDPPITGVLVYDKAFWAYAVHGDDGKRYLLMDNLRTCIDPGDGGFAWEEIEGSNTKLAIGDKPYGAATVGKEDKQRERRMNNEYNNRHDTRQ